MDDAASRIVAHYDRHATSWHADRRAAAWIDKPCIERSFFHLKQMPFWCSSPASLTAKRKVDEFSGSRAVQSNT
jgi:hypothetical protein